MQLTFLDPCDSVAKRGIMRGTPIRWPILAIAVVGVVLAASLLSWFMLTQRPGDSDLPRSAGTNILAIGLDDTADGQRAREIVLVSVSDEGDVAFVLIPDEIAVSGNGGGLVELGSLYGSSGVDGVRSALDRLFSVSVDSTITMDATALAAFIDGMGELPITADAAVGYSESSSGESRVEIQAGEHMLDGADAVAYLRGDSETSRRVRLQQVLRAMLTRGFIGQTDRAIRQRAKDLQSVASTSLSASALADVARMLGRLDPEEIRASIVPTEAILTDGVRYVHPRIVETERLLASLIRGLELLTPTEVRVAVFNGNGVRLMASLTADYLRARGFEVTRIANAESFAYPSSYIVVLTEESKAWVLRDALPSQMSIVFPDAFEDHMQALEGLVPFGTDLLLIAGAGMELE